MSSLVSARCTCTGVWRGERPPCTEHEGKLPPGYGRRRDGTVVHLWRTLGMDPPPDRSPDEMVHDWRPVG